MVRLETVLNSWKTAREDTALAVEDFPAQHFDFNPMPELMSFREIARHILDASQALTGMLLAGETNLATPDFREKVKQHVSPLPADADARTLAAELRSALAIRCLELSELPGAFFTEEIT